MSMLTVGQIEEISENGAAEKPDSSSQHFAEQNDAPEPLTNEVMQLHLVNKYAALHLKCDDSSTTFLSGLVEVLRGFNHE